MKRRDMCTQSVTRRTDARVSSGFFAIDSAARFYIALRFNYFGLGFTPASICEDRDY